MSLLNSHKIYGTSWKVDWNFFTHLIRDFLDKHRPIIMNNWLEIINVVSSYGAKIMAIITNSSTSFDLNHWSKCLNWDWY